MIIDRVIYDTLKLHSFPSDLKSSSFILFPFYQHSSKKKNNNYKKAIYRLHIYFVRFCVACPPSKHGENSSELCGNCFQNLPCNHIDGTCMNGCQEGFRGQLCRTSKSAVSYSSKAIRKKAKYSFAFNKISVL